MISLPPLRSETYVQQYAGKPKPSDGRVVVCAGASIVHGTVSHNVVTELSKRLPSFLYVNAGVNGDLAWNVLQVWFVHCEMLFRECLSVVVAAVRRDFGVRTWVYHAHCRNQWRQRIAQVNTKHIAVFSLIFAAIQMHKCTNDAKTCQPHPTKSFTTTAWTNLWRNSWMLHQSRPLLCLRWRCLAKIWSQQHNSECVHTMKLFSRFVCVIDSINWQENRLFVKWMHR